MEMPFVVKILTGDTSGDGHNVTRSHFIRASMIGPEIIRAFEQGVAKLGGVEFDIRRRCDDFEDNTIPSSLQKVYADVLEVRFDELAGPSDETACISEEEFLAIFMATAVYGNRNLKWVEFLPDHTNQLDIGGYGFFAG